MGMYDIITITIWFSVDSLWDKHMYFIYIYIFTLLYRLLYIILHLYIYHIRYKIYTLYIIYSII